jgi:hypothetical protein
MLISFHVSLFDASVSYHEHWNVVLLERQPAHTKLVSTSWNLMHIKMARYYMSESNGICSMKSLIHASFYEQRNDVYIKLHQTQMGGTELQDVCEYTLLEKPHSLRQKGLKHT